VRAPCPHALLAFFQGAWCAWRRSYVVQWSESSPCDTMSVARTHPLFAVKRTAPIVVYTSAGAGVGLSPGVQLHSARRETKEVDIVGRSRRAGPDYSVKATGINSNLGR
jgi:hypothetical protein